MNVVNKKEDLRYMVKDESRDLHRRRRAFLIYQDKLYFIEKGSPMSHWEFCCENFPKMMEKGRGKRIFNQLTRGYYVDGDLVFYKDNFYYDEKVIVDALKYLPQIKETLNLSRVKIYFGFVMGEPGGYWPYDYYYGESMPNNKIKKAPTK